MFEKYKREQPIATTILENSIISNKLSHAYIFETNNYCNAYNLIIDFVKSIFCSNYSNNEHDDNLCQVCNQINTNNYIEFKNKPIGGNKKVYLIKCAEKLNEASSNTILKFLEEPEENIIAILMTPSRYMLLNTILSRCQIISLLSNNVDNDIVNYILNSLNSSLDTEDCKKEYAVEKIELAISFINYYEKYKKDTILFTRNLVFKSITLREEMLVFFDVIKLFYYDCLNYKTKDKIKYFNNYSDMILKISEKNNINALAKKLQLIESVLEKIRLNGNLNLILDKFIIESEGV